MKKYSVLLLILVLHQFNIQAQKKGDSTWYNLALENYAQANLDSAIFYYSKSIKAGYMVAISYSYKAGAEMAGGKIEEAEADLNTALKIDPRESYAHFFKARLNFIYKGDLNAAVFYGRKAVLLNPTNPEFNDLLGLAYSHKEMYDSALIYSHKAVAIDPNYAGSLSNLAVAYLGKGRYDSALIYAQKSVALDPNHASNWSNLALAKENLNRFQDAIDDYTNALKLAGDASTVNLIRTHAAYCFYKLGSYKDALDICTDVVNNDASHAYAYIVRGKVYYALKKDTEACSDLKKALTLDAYPTDHNDARKLLTQIGCK